jgi:uncharacterized delta-60 repeat protein
MHFTRKARWQRRGTPDPTFGTNGAVRIDLGANEQVLTAKRLPDGALLIGGSTSLGNGRMFIAKVTPNGVLDTRFSSDGFNVLATQVPSSAGVAQDLDVRSDGRIIVAGCALLSGRYTPVLWQLLATGENDTSIALNSWLSLPYSDGPNGCFHTVRFSGVDRIIASGFQTAGGSANFALLKLQTTPLTDTTLMHHTLLPIALR